MRSPARTARRQSALLPLAVLLAASLAGCTDVSGEVTVELQVTNMHKEAQTVRVLVLDNDARPLHTWDVTLKPFGSKLASFETAVENIVSFRVTGDQGAAHGMHGGCRTTEPVRYAVQLEADGVAQSLTCNNKPSWP